MQKAKVQAAAVRARRGKDKGREPTVVPDRHLRGIWRLGQVGVIHPRKHVKEKKRRLLGRRRFGFRHHFAVGTDFRTGRLPASPAGMERPLVFFFH